MSETATLSAQAIQRALCELSIVEATTQGFEVTLPQAYHSGNAVAVVIEAEGEGFYIHDNGYAAMLLEGLGVSTSPKLQALLRPSVEAYGCEIFGFRVYRRCTAPSDVAFAAVTVGCASRLVADFALKADAPPLFDFKRALLGRVSDTLPGRVRENEEFVASKGNSYHVSAVILDKFQSKPLAFLEPVSSHQSVARKFREFYDFMLTPELVEIERVAVYDDTKPEITSGDILLLQDVSNPVRHRDTDSRLKAWSTVQ
ncbi:MAG TPA: hypothetical protein VGB79_05005 [Allosphingosinicella sp.]|jgi:hypothetical protein